MKVVFVQPLTPGLLALVLAVLAVFAAAASAAQPATGSGQIVTPVPTVAPVLSMPATRAAAVIATAMGYLNVRYLWGGCTLHGIDCSCLVRNAYLSVGISLPRTTTEQIRFATPIATSQAAAGDLVFFDNTCTGCGANPTHVGLVLGEGRMIDAGDPVQIEPIYSGHNARYGRIP